MWQPTSNRHHKPVTTALAGSKAAATRQHRLQHGELRAPPPRYSAHLTNLACLAGASRSALPAYWIRADEGRCHLPRNSVLCRILVAMITTLVVIQALSCGLFFCVRLPFEHSPYVNYRELMTELDTGTEAADTARSDTPGSWHQAAAPKLIPRVVHQTYRSGRMPASIKQFVRTWQEVNGDAWQVRFYSDDACLSFVRKEFPEYFEAYVNLPKDVERADFFRYMVVLRHGGVYADIDVECRQPLDAVIQPADTLLVGWDLEHADVHSAAQHNCARQRQVANWFFAAASGHPVLRQLCDHIAHSALAVFSNNTVRDTLERTGQGIWTDVVLQHALRHPSAKDEDPWKVRILPQVAFGLRPSEAGSLGPHGLDSVVALHHFMGGWQLGQLPAHRKALQTLMPWVRPASTVAGIYEAVPASNISHYPVSVSFNPPFTMMTNLAGTGDLQAAADVSAAITAHGTWQPGIAPYRRPAVVEALVGALSKHTINRNNSPMKASSAKGAEAAAAMAAAPTASAANRAATGGGRSKAAATEETARNVAAAEYGASVPRGVLVDVGAGHGFFSLAAAARGHKVIAFESSPGSLAAFNASIANNGFGQLIQVHKAVLGAIAGSMCLQVAGSVSQNAAANQHLADSDDMSAVTAGRQRQQQTPTGSAASRSERQRSGGTAAAGASSSGAANSGSDGNSGLAANISNSAQPQLLSREAALRWQRGYPHLIDQAARVAADTMSCADAVQRHRLSDVLANNTAVGALRISAHGHEGWIIEGTLDYLRTVNKPEVIYLEFCPSAMRATGYSQPKRLLQQLYELGYLDMAHAGHVCEQRWLNATSMVRYQGAFRPTYGALPHQPTWCKLRPENFQVVIDLAHIEIPENVLFVLRQQWASKNNSNSNVARVGNNTVADSSRSGRSSGSSNAAAYLSNRQEGMQSHLPNRYS